MSKCLKIIACYLGERRKANNNFSSKEEAINFITEIVETDKKLNPGHDMDILIVHNRIPGDTESEDFINSFDKQITFNGSIKVVHRDNIGGSFCAFEHGFSLYKNEYEYFLFNEDDICFIKENYLSEAISEMNKDNIGFVSFSPLSNTHDMHSGGAFGITKRNILEEAIAKYGQCNPGNSSYNSMEKNESFFTNRIYCLGYKLVELENYSSLAINYEMHSSQNRNVFFTEKNILKPKIYKVGKT